MEILSYVLVSIVAIFGGLFSGYAVASIAKEELKAGKKYFIWLKRILLLAIFTALIFSFSTKSAETWFLIIAALVFLYGFPVGSLLYLRRNF